MGTYPEQYPGELQRLSQVIAGLRQEVQDLRARSFRIPVLDADPPASDPTNMWAFPDGRIRVRMPDGSILNFIKDAAGSTSSSVTKPVVTQQQSYTTTWDATWTASYKGTGAKRSSKLFFGNKDDGNGRQKSLIGYDYASIQAALSGASISRVELYMQPDDAYFYASGVDIHFGSHTNTSEPGSWGGIYRGDVTTVRVTPTALFGGGATYFPRWMDVSVAFGQWLQSGAARGVSINQPTDSKALWGSANGGGVANKIRITYVK